MIDRIIDGPSISVHSTAFFHTYVKLRMGFEGFGRVYNYNEHESNIQSKSVNESTTWIRSLSEKAGGGLSMFRWLVFRYLVWCVPAA